MFMESLVVIDPLVFSCCVENVKFVKVVGSAVVEVSVLLFDFVEFGNV